MYKLELEQFSGPLDLLLQLIESQKLDISQVSLAQVTDQYLAYLDQAAEINVTDLADFLVVATKLLIIKSKLLLPQYDDEEEDSAEQLEAQLKMYKDYLEASQEIAKLIGVQKYLFTRERLPYQAEPSFNPPASLVAEDLRKCFGDILRQIDYVVSLPQKIMQRVVSLQESVSGIREALKRAGNMNFKQMISEAKSKDDMVVCFMALLELIKGGEVAVTQEGVFDDIMIKSV